MNEVENKNKNLIQTLKNEQRNTQKFKDNAMEWKMQMELNDKIQIEIRGKLQMENFDLKKNLESESSLRKKL